MPRFFFNIHDGIDVPDPVGTILPNVEAARAHAIRECGAMLTDPTGTFWRGETWTMEVCDERGAVQFALTFKATMASEAARPPKGSLRH